VKSEELKVKSEELKVKSEELKVKSEELKVIVTSDCCKCLIFKMWINSTSNDFTFVFNF